MKNFFGLLTIAIALISIKADASIIDIQCKMSPRNLPDWSLQSDCRDCYYTMDETIVYKDGSSESFIQLKDKESVFGKFTDGIGRRLVAMSARNIDHVIFNRPQLCESYQYPIGATGPRNCRPANRSITVVENYVQGTCTVIPAAAD
jgi:hypothetical protein